MSVYRPTTRVMAVLELLQAHGQLSGAELARRLQVDGRTVRRYIAALDEMGVPIVSERGRYGKYGLMPGYKLPPMIFNNDEALALALGLVAASRLGMAESAAAIASAQSKLERVMPPQLEPALRALRQTVLLDLPNAEPLRDKQMLQTLSAATYARRRVHMHYLSAQGQLSARDFDPYRVLYQRSAWYAVGWCHFRQELRSFRLDRMSDVALLEQTFQQPQDFDAIAFLRRAVANLPRKFAIRVWIKSDMAMVGNEVEDWLGVLETHEQGVLLHAQADDLAWFARKLAALPYAFEILHPPALKLAVTELALHLLRQVTTEIP